MRTDIHWLSTALDPATVLGSATHSEVRDSTPGYEGDAQRMAAKIKDVGTGYVYGQLINSIITAVMVWAVLALVGLPGAFVMAVLMLVLNMTPTIGPGRAHPSGIERRCWDLTVRPRRTRGTSPTHATPLPPVTHGYHGDSFSPSVVGG
jgi:hypothetical protein